MLLSLWGLATIVFLMTKAIPGDEARVAAGPSASPEVVAMVRHHLGLDRSPTAQYLNFLWRLLHGDLGTSISTLQPVRSDLATALPTTLQLAGTCALITVVVGVPLGIVSAAYRGRWLDKGVRVSAVVLGGLPIFWFAFMLQYVVGARWRLLPVSGVASSDVSIPRRTGFTLIDSLLAGSMHNFLDVASHLVMPAVALAAPFCAATMRITRNALLTEMGQEYVMVAVAKGTSMRRVLFRHALRNALIPTAAVVGLQIGWMVGGSVLVESIFSQPGVGLYLTNAILQKDTFAVLGSVLFIGVVVVLANFLADLVQLVLDPRVRRDTVRA